MAHIHLKQASHTLVILTAANALRVEPGEVDDKFFLANKDAELM